MNKVLKAFKDHTEVTAICTDLFDTLIHRTVHPNYVYLLWAKHLKRELGLRLDHQELFQTRMDAVRYVSGKMELNKVEVPYDLAMREVFDRLVTSDHLANVDFDRFFELCRKADYRAEISVQFLNESLVSGLRQLKKEGYPIILISDFHLTEVSYKSCWSIMASTIFLIMSSSVVMSS